MSDQWPPPAPDVNKAFKKVNNLTNDNTPLPAPGTVVTKKMVQDLEKQLSKPAPVLKPSGMSSSNELEKRNRERLARMQERLRKPEGKARDDFNRTNER